MAGRPRKMHGKCVYLNAMIYEHQKREMAEITDMLSERTGRKVSRGDLMRVAVEVVMDLSVSEIIERMEA